MCGIFGVLNVDSPSGLETCARTLSHRGPDAFGSHYDQHAGVYLAHCRLSIIDLSGAGRQPMTNEDQSIWLTFNGEIYNYKILREELLRRGHIFRSQADSEVIVHAYEQWGIACVHRFEGMFAFGLWDANIKRFFLVRDRVGIKPVYFLYLGKTLAFSSEPRALVRLPDYKRGIDFEAVKSLLIYSYIAGEQSIWKDIKRLGPGQILTFELAHAKVTVSTYWKLAASIKDWSEKEAQEEFCELFGAAVASHLVSDVPLGVFLSGGIDSTAVAKEASMHKSGIDAISIGFPDATSDELPIAEKSAQMMGACWHKASVSASRHEELMNVFSLLDEPSGDHAIFPTYLMCKEARTQVKVALSGDGGDEVFAGYNWYFQTENVSQQKKVLFQLGDMLGKSLTGLSSAFSRLDRFQHYLLMNSPGFTSREITALFPGFADSSGNKDEAHLYRVYSGEGLEPIKSWQFVDFHTYLVDNNLLRIDRMSMACSLEVRVPLLDHRLVEFAFSLPDRLCAGGNQGKLVLREYLRNQGLLHVLDQPKRGFSFPLNRFWPLADMVTLLASSHMARDGIANARNLAKTLQNDQAFNFAYKIWLLAVLEMWYRKWYE